MSSTLFPRGGSFTIDGVHSDYFGMFYKNWAYDVVPTIRSGLVDIPGRRGKQDNGSELSSRMFSMDLVIYDPDPSTRWTYMNRWAVANNPETGPHRIELVDERAGWYLLGQPGAGTASPELVTAKFTQSWELADPHWYSTLPVSVIEDYYGSPAYGGFTNDGNTYVEPLITVTMRPDQLVPVVAPILRIGNTEVRWAGTLAGGESLQINCATKEILYNGVNDIARWSGAFPIIPPGPFVVGLNNTVWQDQTGSGGRAIYSFTPRLL